MKPLVFLAAAGALGDEELSILCVDNDATNGSLKESMKLIQLYDAVRGEQKWLGDLPFFRPKLRLVDDHPWSPFVASQEQTLDHYLGYESMLAKEKNLTALYEFLYDKGKRKLSVSEGFRGKPSIGAAVYRAAARTTGATPEDGLHSLRMQLQNGAAQGKTVKLFSMGSIFGGTGAAGLPSIPVSLIDSMSNGKDKVLSGAAFLLPYFSFNTNGLEKQGPHAKPSDFIMMMKDALRYYSANSSRYQCVYAVGSDSWRHVKTAAVGKEMQNNEADLVEFLAALAASHFLVSWQPSADTRINTQADAVKPDLYVLHREHAKEFHWTDIPEQARIKPQLAAFTRFCFLFLSEFAPKLESGSPEGQAWFQDHIKNASVTHTSAEFQGQVASLKAFCSQFLRWWSDLHRDSGLGLKLISTDAFDGGKYYEAKFRTMVTGEVFRSSAKEAKQAIPRVEQEHKSQQLSGLGHFVKALAEVTKA